MNLSVNRLSAGSSAQFLQRKNQEQLNRQNLNTNEPMRFSSAASLAQKAAVMPAISFGSLKAKKIETALNMLVQKYSQGKNPLILNVKSDFIPQLSKKIATSDKPLIVGVTGQSASGKSTLIDKIYETLGQSQSKDNSLINIIRGDDYFKDTSHLLKKYGNFEGIINSGYSFDVPAAADLKTMVMDLKKLSEGSEVMSPKYDYLTCKVFPNSQKIKPSKIVLLDSIFALQPEVKNSLDIGIYVDCAADTLKKRWFKRAETRGPFGKSAEKLFADTTKKAQEYVIPSSKSAHMTLNGEAAIDKMKEFVMDLQRIFSKLDKAKAA